MRCLGTSPTRRTISSTSPVLGTGYLSPSAAQLLVVEKGWQQRTRVTHAYHMGCYAALPAIRIGSGFLTSTTHLGYRVDIAHTELLHLAP